MPAKVRGKQHAGTERGNTQGQSGCWEQARSALEEPGIPGSAPGVHQGDPVLFRVQRAHPWPVLRLSKALAGARGKSRGQRGASCTCGTPQTSTPEDGRDGVPRARKEGSHEAGLGAGCPCASQGSLVLLSCTATPTPQALSPLLQDQVQAGSAGRPGAGGAVQGRTGVPSRADTPGMPRGERGQQDDACGGSTGTATWDSLLLQSLQQVQSVQQQVQRSVLLATSCLVQRGLILMDQYRSRSVTDLYHSALPSTHRSLTRVALLQVTDL